MKPAGFSAYRACERIAGVDFWLDLQQPYEEAVMATTKRIAKKAIGKTAAPAAKPASRKPVAKKATKTAVSKAPKKVAKKTAKLKKTSAAPKKAPLKKAKLPGKAAKPAASAATKQATKEPRRRSKPLIEKPAPVPNLHHAVNMGPERGDNTFPPSYKKAVDTDHPV